MMPTVCNGVHPYLSAEALSTPARLSGHFVIGDGSRVIDNVSQSTSLQTSP